MNAFKSNLKTYLSRDVYCKALIILCKRYMNYFFVRMFVRTTKILIVQTRFQKHHEATTDSKYSVIETKAVYIFSLLSIYSCRVIIC